MPFFMHLAGNSQSMLPVVKLQVFFGIQALYTVEKSGILQGLQETVLAVW